MTDTNFCWCAMVCLVDKNERCYLIKAEAQNNNRKILKGDKSFEQDYV